MLVRELLETFDFGTYASLVNFANRLTRFYHESLIPYTKDWWDENKDDPDTKKLNFVLGSKKARWFNEHYLSSRAKRVSGIEQHFRAASREETTAKDAFKTLGNLPVHAFRGTHANETGSKHLDAISHLLPSALKTLGEERGKKDLIEAAAALKKAVQQFETAKAGAGVEHTPKTTRKSSEPKTTETDSTHSTQRALADKVVNDIINTLPEKVRGKIRNKIAKAGNKLLAMKIEMDNLKRTGEL
jgi:hypothetical protein